MKTRTPQSTEMVQRLLTKNINVLPSELLIEVFTYLDPDTLPTLSRVSKRWQQDVLNRYTLSIVICRSLGVSPTAIEQKVHHEINTAEWKKEYEKYCQVRAERRMLEEKINYDRPYVQELERNAIRTLRVHAEPTPCIYRRDTYTAGGLTAVGGGGLSYLIGWFTCPAAAPYLACLAAFSGGAFASVLQTAWVAYRYEQRQARLESLNQAERPLLEEMAEETRSQLLLGPPRYQ